MNSKVLDTVFESASGLYDIGLINSVTMQDFAQLCGRNEMKIWNPNHPLHHIAIMIDEQVPQLGEPGYEVLESYDKD